MSQQWKSDSNDEWTMQRLMLGIGVLYVFVQLVTLGRALYENALNNALTPVSELVVERIIGTFVGFSFIALIIYFTRHLLRRGWHSYRIMLLHLLLILPVTFVWYFLFYQATIPFLGPLPPPIIEGQQLTYMQELLYYYGRNSNTLVVIYMLAVAVTYTYDYVRRDNENRLRQSQMETNVLQARMKLLHSQLHPHFLFNTLNSVNSLMDIDVRKAQAMVVDLADLLRKVLDWKDVQTVPLKEELNLLRRYVDIEKMRFSDDMAVHWHIDEQLLPYHVPGMLLQPLVENAIHHGFSEDHLQINIHIEAQREADTLVLRVSDDGCGFPTSDERHVFEKGTGLQNTRERLRTLYGDAFFFRVYNSRPGVVSELSIPLQMPH